MHPTNQENTLSNQLPEGWTILEFPKTIINRRINVGKVKKEDYSPSGKYPIIDQSQDFVAGYSDDEALVYTGNLPVVIFGDHTRIFKYVDFPFICGADGTKVLLPNQEFVHPGYYFFALCNLDIPSKGYNRHYKLLKEQDIPLPPLPEQRAIAHVLTTVRQAIDATEQAIAAAQELKRSMMKHLFTYGPVPVHEADQVPLKETEIGHFPDEWLEKPLGKIATLQRGNDLPKRKRKPGIYPVIGSNGIVDYHSEYIADGIGVFVGRSGSVGEVTRINTAYWPLNTTLWVKDFHGNDRNFVYFLLKHFNFRRYTSGVSVPTLNRNLVHPIIVGLPDLQNQQQIAYILDVIEDKIHAETMKTKSIEALFNSLLQNLMTGKVRVSIG